MRKTLPYLGLPVILPREASTVERNLADAGDGVPKAIPKMLKKRWQRATCHASTGLDVTTVAAMTPVRVVPMLAPRVRGSMSSRVMRPTAARGVRVEVVMEEDCEDGDAHANHDVEVPVEADDGAQHARGGALNDDLEEVQPRRRGKSRGR